MTREEAAAFATKWTAAWNDRAVIGELDLNPITVLPRGQGCVVVDALIVPRAPR